jgi:hypothetical protein
MFRTPDPSLLDATNDMDKWYENPSLQPDVDFIDNGDVQF